MRQGRYTFRHDCVLGVIHTCLLSFLKTIEPKSSIVTNDKKNKPLTHNFIKQGSKPPKRKPIPETGILHLAIDWKLLIDSNGSLVFPAFIAITTSRPDIVIYSKSTKTVILLELTCPCEENFQERHSDKVIKYSALCNQIRSNGWQVHYFAIEIGARGYCAQNVFSCFRRLGFSKKSSREILKDLSFTSLAASFTIWLKRDDKSWDTNRPAEVMKRPRLSKVPNTELPSYNKTHKSATSPKSITASPDNKLTSVVRAGILNKGQTCYVNALLQALTTLQVLWSVIASNTVEDDLFITSFLEIMYSIESTKKLIDPSRFLRALTTVIHNSGQQNFIIFSQQDAAEVLEYILNKFCSSSVLGKDKLALVVRWTITCDTCFQESSSQTSSLTWQVPADQTLQSALDKSFKSEELAEHVCMFCDSKQPASLDHKIVSSKAYLILHMKRFNQLKANQIVKDQSVVQCLDNLVVDCGVDEDVSFQHTYRLCATVNHTGTLHAGHYTAFVQERSSSLRTWSMCNDKAITNSKQSNVNNDSSYIFFLQACVIPMPF